MTKDEKIKEAPEVVKSRSTRHALERVLKSVQLHLPPDGISERDAMGMIIEAVDPMPDDFDSEKCIKEVMELADYMASLAMVVGIDIAEGNEEREKANRHIMQLASDELEAKLRQLIQ